MVAGTGIGKDCSIIRMAFAVRSLLGAAHDITHLLASHGEGVSLQHMSRGCKGNLLPTIFPVRHSELVLGIAGSSKPV